MRLAAVDIGSNSTRLLIADRDETGRLTDVLHRSTVTRLGHGVDRHGQLDPAAIERVYAALTEFQALTDQHRVERTVGVLTSAVRDATDGAAFTATVRERFGIDARTIPGELEAALTLRGTTSGRGASAQPVAVVDIGGGSSEFVVGHGGAVDFSVSVQAGVVRQSERHLHHDPPRHDELTALADDVRESFGAALPAAAVATTSTVIAVAGTATSCAAIVQELDVYDPERVHGFRLDLAEIEELTARLALMDEQERREVVGLHPDRAPTIVAGCVLLTVALRAFGVSGCEVSEHDILHGAILVAAEGAF